MPEGNNEGSRKIGLAGTLGGIAAVITAIATLLTAFNAFSHSSPDTKAATHQESPAATAGTGAPAPTEQPKPSRSTAPATANAATAPREGNVADRPGFGPDINGYWTTVPKEPLKLPYMVFYFEVHGTKVTGTLRNPCKDDAPGVIESGFYDGHSLHLRITGMPDGNVYALVAEAVGDHFEGPMGGGTEKNLGLHNSFVVVKSGFVPCRK
jgi:hypothetical protein